MLYCCLNVNFMESGENQCTMIIVTDIRVLINNSSSNTTTFSDWGKIRHSVPQGSILGPLFFLIYINDLPNITADLSKPILFPDDTSVIITNPSPSKFKKDINNIIDNINDWFRGNTLSLNFDRT